MSLQKIVKDITNIGYEWHKQSILNHSIKNVAYIKKTINDLPEIQDKKRKSAVVISAGPSLHYNNTLEILANADYKGTVIAIDGSYVKCLKAGIIPDYVLTLDPHPTRMVRWFGDPLFAENIEGDNYFARQDLDIDFRENSIKNNEENIQLVNKYAKQTKLIISSTSPGNMVKRSIEASFDMYWWMPLVDDPEQEGSITRKIYDITKLPALNTGGNVGTSAWIFAQFWLNFDSISVVGMDLGYKKDLPYNMTQTYPELVDMLGEENVTAEYFPESIFPQTGEKFYSDPTYTWYKQNFLELVKNSKVVVNNCTEGGTLFGDGIKCFSLKEFMAIDYD